MKSFDELQARLALIGEIPSPRNLDSVLIDSCDDYADAVRLCLDKRIRRLSEAEIAATCGMQPAQLAKIKSGMAHMPANAEAILMVLCSNRAPKQYREMMERQAELAAESPANVIARLQAQIAEQQRRAA